MTERARADPARADGLNGGMAKVGGTRRELVEHEIVEAAAREFSVRGFGGTNLQHIADALGMSRSALYHYVSGKEELLRLVVADAMAEVANELESIGARPADASVRLSAVMAALLARIAASPARFRLLETGERDLPRAVVRARNRARQRCLDVLEKILHDGISAGEFRPVDVEITALSLLGMMAFAAFWFPGAGEVDPVKVAQVMSELVLQGLADGDHGGRAGSVPNRLLERIRSDLAELERSIREG